MILAVIFIILIILGIGLPILLLIVPKSNLFIKIGFSFPIGIGIFTLLMFLSNLLGIKFSLLNEFIIYFTFSIPLILLAGKRIKDFCGDLFKIFKHPNFSLLELTMLGILAFLVITSFINTFYWPVHIWDSVVLYDFRGHVFADTGFMKSAFIDAYYYSYPLLTSLAHAIVYLSGGRYPQFLYSLFYLSLGLSFYGLLRSFISRRASILFTLILLVSSPLFYHSLISLTNMPFSVYISLGAICIYLWDSKQTLRDKNKEIGYLVLSALLVGFSTWVRAVEPFWLAAILIVFLISLYRKRVVNFFIYSFIVFPIREGWDLFQNSLLAGEKIPTKEVSTYTKVLLFIFDINKWQQIMVFLYKFVVCPWGAIFIVFVLVIIAAFLLKKQKDLLLIFFIVFVFLAVLAVGTFYFSLTTDYWYQIGDATERLSMLFYPLFVYCIALVMHEVVKIKK